MARRPEHFSTDGCRVSQKNAVFHPVDVRECRSTIWSLKTSPKIRWWLVTILTMYSLYAYIYIITNTCSYHFHHSTLPLHYHFMGIDIQASSPLPGFAFFGLLWAPANGRDGTFMRRNDLLQCIVLTDEVGTVGPL